MTNGQDIHSRLYAAALRVIASNSISVVGKDGRRRFDFESVVAHGELASVLRELYGEGLPRHEPVCAARGRMPAECDCSVAQIISRTRCPQ